MNPTVIIDEEFKALIPPSSAEEIDLLTKSVIGQGCHDALKVWHTSDGDVLLDGYTRHGICSKYGVEFDIKPVDVSTREQAREWILRNQLGRRNLSPAEISLLRGRLYNQLKGEQGGDHKSKCQSDTLINAADELAAEHGVSPETIKRDGKLAEAVDVLKETEPDIEEQVLSGGVSRADVVAKSQGKPPVRQSTPESKPIDIKVIGQKFLEDVGTVLAERPEAKPSLIRMLEELLAQLRATT